MATEKESAFSEKQHEWHYNMLKGRVAEALIEEMFISLGYNVFRYGMENTIPGIMELLRGVKSDVVLHIRKMPDLVVQKDKQVFFIEVKFRKNESFTLKDLGENYPYKDAYIVVVSKKHIKCVTVKELENGKIISPESRNYLGSRSEFKESKEKIIEFCNFAVKFFENVA